jgi:hypothetical protein
MKVKFQTKEESKLAQELTFLRLSAGERFTYWLNLMVASQQVPSKTPKEKSDNFLIEIQG